MAVSKHPDHDYIVACHKQYVEAYNNGSTEQTMEFMDKENLVYSDFGLPFCLTLCNYNSSS